MTSSEIRQSFLDYFKRQGHTIVPSSSLLPDAPPRELARLTVENPWSRALAFSPDNQRLAVGSESGAVTVLNAATRLPVATLRANDLPVYRIWFDASEDQLVTFSPGAIGLWRASGH